MCILSICDSETNCVFNNAPSLHPLHVTHNYADCIGNYCNAILSDHFRSLLAQFGLTPKFGRSLAASDPGEAF
jgi:hypothetical protein